MQKRAITNLPRLKAEALQLISQLDEIGEAIESKLDLALERAWRLGQKFVEIKLDVGHGNWMTWVENNLPITDRHARRFMELASENPGAKAVKDLSAESVRKFRGLYVPDKERPELPGDRDVPSVSHHLQIVNDFRRFHRRLEIKQASLNEPEARRDLWPLFEWLSGLYGVRRDAVAEVRPEGDAVATLRPSQT